MIMQKIYPSIHLLEVFMPIVDDEPFFVNEVVSRIPDIPFYKGIETGVIHEAGLRRKVREVKEANGYQLTVWLSPDLNDNGFNLSAIDKDLRTKSVKKAIELIDMAAEMGADHCGIPCGPYPGDALCDEAKKVLTDSYIQMLDHVESIQGVDLTFDRIDSAMMELYEAELHGRGLSRNTSSFYMRILRTNYRMAVEMGLTLDRHPFKHVYCGMDKTAKRSISFADIKRIKDLDLRKMPVLDFVRDMFVFSFCTRGMSFIDMAYLRKADLKNGYLTYRRKKTGQLLTIEWTSQMQEILDKYAPVPTRYLLPIITREDGSERRQYQNQMMKINRRLKEIAAMINLSVPLSLYFSRHSWATIARGKDVPLSVISEGLGHDSEITTQIYLDSIKSWEVDKANRKILEDL